VLNLVAVVLVTAAVNMALFNGSRHGNGVRGAALSACTTAAADDANANSSADSLATSVRAQYGLFVGVLSASGHFDARQAIRETWGQDPRLLRVTFFTLRPKSNETLLQLQEEAAQVGDLIVTSEVAEDYYNITYSTLALFRAAAAYGPQVKYVLKADDDAYIRVSLLLEALKGAPSTWVYAGHAMRAHDIPRPPGRRWGIAYSNWPSNKSVVYGWGQVGYVLLVDLVRRIAAGAPHLIIAADNLVIVEDIAVGLWVHALSELHNETASHIVLPYHPQCDADALSVSATLWVPRAQHMRCAHRRSGGKCCRDLVD
jgi:hypothetical protein